MGEENKNPVEAKAEENTTEETTEVVVEESTEAVVEESDAVVVSSDEVAEAVGVGAIVFNYLFNNIVDKPAVAVVHLGSGGLTGREDQIVVDGLVFLVYNSQVNIEKIWCIFF